MHTFASFSGKDKAAGCQMPLEPNGFFRFSGGVLAACTSACALEMGRVPLISMWPRRSCLLRHGEEVLSLLQDLCHALPRLATPCATGKQGAVWRDSRAVVTHRCAARSVPCRVRLSFSFARSDALPPNQHSRCLASHGLGFVASFSSSG